MECYESQTERVAQQSDLTFNERKSLKKLFRMGGGYILDFSNRTFTEFVAESHQNLYQSWFHSFEEKEQPTESIRIYRPEGFKEFPPSKFRMKYVFEKDDSCQWLVLYPADAHYLTSGRWETSPMMTR